MSSHCFNSFRLFALVAACFLVATNVGCDSDDRGLTVKPPDKPPELIKKGLIKTPGGKLPAAIYWVWDPTLLKWMEKTITAVTSTRNDGLTGGAKAAATSTGGGAPNAQSKIMPNAALFCGGIGKRPDFPDSTPQAYFYDFAADEWTGLEMGSPRRLHTMTTLLDGRILIVGGWDGKEVPNVGEPAVSSTELFDPTNLTFRPGGALLAARRGHAAARLLDGRVLILGGGTGITATDDDVAGSVEIYDPATDSFAVTGSMLVPRSVPMATTLDDGRVLVCGDHFLTTAEVFDPATGTFSAVGDMTAVHGYGATATKLKDGKVLILGGAGAGGLKPTAIAEIFDPVAHSFSALAPMRIQRANHLAVLQDDGTVLVAGGSNFEGGGFKETPWSDSFDPATNTFSPLPDMPTYSSSGAGVFLQQ